MQLTYTSIFKKITPGLFRLFLAGLVMVYHSVAFLPLGHYAVYVFFMLSGYWIFKMYKEKYSKYVNPYWVYLQSRIFRLLPTYWTILVFSILVFIITGYFGRKTDYSFLTISNIVENIFVIGISNSHRQFLIPSWSLDIELQFYVTAPLLLLIGMQNKGLFYLSVIAIASLIFVIFSGVNINVWSIMFTFLPFFLMGATIYLCNFKSSTSFAVTCLFIAIFILALNYFLPSIRDNYLLNKNANLYTFNYQALLNILLALLTIPFVVVNVKSSDISSRDGLWSSMSYVVYLLHWPLLQIYAMTVLHITMLQKYIHIIIYYFVCFSLSWVFSTYIDSYFEGKRIIWLRKQKYRY